MEPINRTEEKTSMDPYKVLGVGPDTSNDDIKRAYRELARKYHPDNYVNNPLYDLAEKRMKEINAAYDEIMAMRNSGSSGSSSSQSGYNSQGSGSSSYSSNPAYTQIRSAINSGNIAMAEELLQRCQTRDAEWHFLMGSVYYKKGWFDEAGRSFTQAVNMNPNNAEYRNALNMLNMSSNYGGYRPMNSANMCDCCMQLLCLQCCCSSCCGGGC